MRPLAFPSLECGIRASCTKCASDGWNLSPFEAKAEKPQKT